MSEGSGIGVESEDSGEESMDPDFMPGVSGMDGSSGTAFERALWGSLGMPAGNLVLAGAKKKRAAKVTIVDIAVAATFGSPWPDATAETKALRKENGAKWSPTVVDFRSGAAKIVKKGRLYEIGTLGRLLGVLEGRTKAGQQIRRLSLFTHANSQNLAMTGRVEADGDVFLGSPDPDDPLRSRGIDTATLAELDDLLTKDTSGLRDRIKRAWAPNAELWIYACDAAVSSTFTSALAKTLGVTVKAFDKEVWFLPSFTSSPDKIVDRNFYAVASSEAAAQANMTQNIRDLDGQASTSGP